MATWPVSLTQKFLEDQVTQTYQDNVAAFTPDVGDSIKRQRYTKAFKPTTGPIFVTDAEKATLESFFESDCSFGVESFTWSDYLNVTRTYSWVSPPSFTRMFPGWRVELNLLEHT